MYPKVEARLLLSAKFYDGLKDEIKDHISHEGREHDLDAIIAQATHWDTRLQACRVEKRAAAPRYNPKSAFSSGSTYSSTLTSPSYSIRSRSSKPPQWTTVHVRTDIEPSLVRRSIIGADGHLTKEAQEHHHQNKLCFLCGRSGHMSKDCPQRRLFNEGTKKSVSSVQARAAELVDEEQVQEENWIPLDDHDQTLCREE
jgi:hypothetical protein